MMYVALVVGLAVMSVFVTGGLAAAVSRYRTSPGTGWFAALMALCALWSGVTVAGLVFVDDRWRLAWHAFEQSICVWVPVVWTGFALAYSGREDLLSTRLLAGLSIVPAATVVAIATADSHDLVWVDAAIHTVEGITTISTTLGPIAALSRAYTYVLVLYGAVMLVGRLASEPGSYRGQTVAVVVGVAIPVGASALTIAGDVPVAGLDLVPTSFAISGVVFGYALFAGRLFESTPAVRRAGEAAAIEGLDDGVAIVDTGGRILTLNPTAAALLDCDRDEAVGKSLSALSRERIGIDVLEAGSFATDDDREYDVTTSTITDRAGDRIGDTVLFRDVTDLELERQRLEVLNRLLRHNLRNDLNVIDGYAATLAEELDGGRADLARQIRTVVTELDDLGNKVRRMETIMERGERPEHDVSVTEIAAEVVATTRWRYPDAIVELRRRDGVTASVEPKLLKIALEELVENAVEHSDQAEPTAVVEVRTEAGHLSIAVADEGPGIPDQEREAILEGEETALRHASSLGLWLVYWSVRQLGGHVTFDESDLGGNEIVVHVPLEESSDPNGDRASER